MAANPRHQRQLPGGTDQRHSVHLTHNFKRQKAKAGTLFSLPSTDYRTPGKNIVIYGHHLSHRPNAMISLLLNYKQIGYGHKYPEVLLDRVSTLPQ